MSSRRADAPLGSIAGVRTPFLNEGDDEAKHEGKVPKLILQYHRSCFLINAEIF
jgi:hypothetical protein